MAIGRVDEASSQVVAEERNGCGMTAIGPFSVPPVSALFSA
jgi:hypothetical protein